MDIVRLNNRYFNKIAFSKAIDDLSESEYRQNIDQSDAPKITSCVTAIRYLVKESTWKWFFRHFIWSLPWEIERTWEWKIIKDIDYLITWDLLFLKRKDVDVKITHMWIYTWEKDLFFHQSFFSRKKIENIWIILEKYEMVDWDTMKKYKDPRFR